MKTRSEAKVRLKIDELENDTYGCVVLSWSRIFFVFYKMTTLHSQLHLLFTGEKLARYSYPDLGYEIGPKFEKQAEMLPPHMMDQAINDAMTYLGTNNLRPLLHHPGPPLSMTEVMPMINPMYHPAVMSLGHRTECRGNSETLPPQPSHFLNHPTSNGPSNALTRQSKSLQSAQEESPSNSGIDSADSARSSPQDKQSYHGSTVPPGLRSRGSPAVHCSNDRAPDVSPKSGGRPGAGMMRIPAERSASNEGVRVFGREGNELRAFQCEHCQVLFLDHVMYTIHMGCHGYRDPLECNICGHQSKDRYEFSSHIVRGEHTFHWGEGQEPRRVQKQKEPEPVPHPYLLWKLHRWMAL